jgi:hypothetical protein
VTVDGACRPPRDLAAATECDIGFANLPMDVLDVTAEELV